MSQLYGPGSVEHVAALLESLDFVPEDRYIVYKEEELQKMKRSAEKEYAKELKQAELRGDEALIEAIQTKTKRAVDEVQVRQDHAILVRQLLVDLRIKYSKPIDLSKHGKGERRRQYGLQRQEEEEEEGEEIQTEKKARSE
jgi:hypothetical protein